MKQEGNTCDRPSTLPHKWTDQLSTFTKEAVRRCRGPRGARAAHGLATFAVILLLCSCASTHAANGQEQISSTMPDALTGVWYKNDDLGRELCESYRKIKSVDELGEEANPLIGSLIITKGLVHAYAEYGEGSFYAVERVVGLGNQSWQIDASIGIDTLPSDEDQVAEGAFRFTVASGLLSMDEVNAANDSALAAGFFRCGDAISGLYEDQEDTVQQQMTIKRGD